MWPVSFIMSCFSSEFGFQVNYRIRADICFIIYFDKDKLALRFADPFTFVCSPTYNNVDWLF